MGAELRAKIDGFMDSFNQLTADRVVVPNHRDRESQRCRVRRNKRGEDEENMSLFFDEFRTT